MRGSYVLFTVQRYGESLGFENENSYNEGAKFLKLCRDFPWQKHPYCKGIETVSIEKRQIFACICRILCNFAADFNRFNSAI